jgi:hypothetical protein
MDTMPQTHDVIEVTKEKKPTYKSIMADLLKPPPKDDTKPNIHLGGGHFTKLEKI